MGTTANDVIELLDAFDGAGLVAIVDGGWGVDALLGRQTRPHADLDIALDHAGVPRLRAVLAARGFEPIEHGDTKEWNFVLATREGVMVDVHSFVFDPPYDPAGAVPGLPDDRPIEGVPYPRRSLYGSGVIAGRPVRCITPEYMVEFHTGYAVDVDDFADTMALCQAFGLELPSDYEAFGAPD